jgi:hypothetical protein
MTDFKPIRAIIATGALALFAAAAPAQAAIVFQDNFDSEEATTVLDYTDLDNWNIVGFPSAGGRVDLINNANPYGITCAGNAGACLDMDGTTNLGGTLRTKGFFTAGTYTLSFDLSGNQRNFPTDELIVDFGSVVNQSIFVDANDPFQTFNFNVTVGPGGAFLTLAHSGGDQVGPILDNVVVDGDGAYVTALPAPAGGLLLGAALFLALRGRRRRTA